MKILILRDYLGRFGSKRFANPYMSGFDLRNLIECAEQLGFTIDYTSFSQVLDMDLSHFDMILYTSSEDKSLVYKSWIEDVIYHLETKGLPVYPSFEILRAHNNKVAMELTSTRLLKDMDVMLPVIYFSEPSELNQNIKFPKVLKSSVGAKSTGVSIVKSFEELLVRTDLKKRQIFRFPKDAIKEYLRPLKHKNYKRETLIFGKYILQDLVKDLNYDYKVLVFGNRIYTMKRYVLPNDFRASGSGKFEYLKDVPKELLDTALDICEKLGLKMVSLDLVECNGKYKMVEWQGIFFGTTAAEKSDYHWVKNEGKWKLSSEKLGIEELFLEAL